MYCSSLVCFTNHLAYAMELACHAHSPSMGGGLAIKPSVSIYMGRALNCIPSCMLYAT